MGTVVKFRPYADQTVWLCTRMIEPKLPRLAFTFSKITRTFYCKDISIPDYLELFAWYKRTRLIDTFLGKEINRFEKLIKRRLKQQPQSSRKKHIYHFKVSNPISTFFYQLIVKYDYAIHLIKICSDAGLLEYRQIYTHRHRLYTKKLLGFIMRICRYKSQSMTSETLLVAEQKQMSLALESKVMPVLDESV